MELPPEHPPATLLEVAREWTALVRSGGERGWVYTRDNGRLVAFAALGLAGMGYLFAVLTMVGAAVDVPVAVRRARPAARVTVSYAEREPETLKVSSLASDSPDDAFEPAAPTVDEARASRQMVWPILGSTITSGYGARVDPVNGAGFQTHRGLDIRSECGTPVVAAANGEVVFADLTERSGITVKISHGPGMMTRYAHLSRADVSVGDRVRAGEPIGLSGATGRITGPHLHFEIWKNNAPRNPLAFHYRHLASARFDRQSEECGIEYVPGVADSFAVPSVGGGAPSTGSAEEILQQLLSAR